MPRFNREDLLKKFNEMKAAGIPIVGGGAGTGLSAKCEEEGGIDLIVIYNSGRYRMAGRGSLSGLLAYGNANEIVKEMASEVLIDGNFRANLEETGMSYAQEVDVIRLAHEKGMFTTPYVFSEEDAAAMANAGADIIVCHLGLTTGGNIGAETAVTLDDCVEQIDSWSAAALAVNPDAIVLCHGGPIAMPQDAEYILKRTKNCHGFYGASSMERLPTEVALVEQTKAFKQIKFG